MRKSYKSWKVESAKNNKIFISEGMTTKFLLFVLLAIQYCKAMDHILRNSSTISSRHYIPDIPEDVIENWLTKALLTIGSLHLNLRSTNYQEDVSNSYTKWFLKQILVPITISIYDLKENNETTSSDNYRTNYAIVTSMKDLRSAARQFEGRATTYFFIVVGDIDLKELHGFLHLWWKQFHVLNNFMLTSNGVLVYDPFALQESGAYGKVVEYTGKETLERTVFHDMRGYPLRVQLFKSAYSKPVVDPVTKSVKYVQGVDGQVAYLLQKQMNFTMELQYPDPNFFGVRSDNGTYNGVIGSIVNNELDLCLTGFFIKEYMVPELKFSVAVYDDKLCIFTPKAKRIPESILPIFAVSYDFWGSFILMGFVCCILWAALRALNLRFIAFQVHERRLAKSLRWQYVQILIDTWLVWVRVNINKYPPFHSEKIFVASLCLISLIFGSIFESSLRTVYIKRLYYKDIATLQELDESGLNVMYKYASMGDDLFFSETSQLFANLNKKLRFVNDLSADIIEDVGKSGGMAGVTRYTNLMQNSLHLILSKKVWLVPECPKYYAISYVWRNGAPWENTINILLLQMLNAGLIRKFIADMQTQIDIKIMKDHLYEIQQEFKILTVEDLQLAFYVVLTGSLMAFVSLIIERKIRQ